MIKRRLKSELKLSLTEPQLRLFSFAVFHAHYVLAGMFERLRLYWLDYKALTYLEVLQMPIYRILSDHRARRDFFLDIQIYTE